MKSICVAALLIAKLKLQNGGLYSREVVSSSPGQKELLYHPPALALALALALAAESALAKSLT